MHRALLAALLAVLLLPAAQAAGTGARPAFTVDGAVNDVAMAGNGRFVAVSADPTDRFTGGGDTPTWNLWNVDGSLRAQGSADYPGCPSSPPQRVPPDDCKSDATRVAVSDDGKFLVVASALDGNDHAVLSFFNDAGTRSKTYFYDGSTGNGAQGTISDVAISADGTRAAVALRMANATNPNNPTGLVQVFDGAGNAVTMFPGTGKAYAKPATAVSLSPDGSVLDVAAGAHYRYAVGSSASEVKHALSGTATDVDTAAGWSVAGFSTGFFALYNAHIDGNNPSAYQKKEAGETTAINAVALRRDASAFATGSSGGTLRYYALDPGASVDQVTLVATKTGLGGVVAAAFSGDGRYLAVRSGTDSVRLYRASDSGLEELWHDTHASLGSGLGIDARGEHVVAHTTDASHAVLVYDAVHRLTASVPAATQQAGTTANYTIAYRNDGNRAEDATVTAAFPSGLSVAVNPGQFSVAPGATQQVTATVTVASTRAPGAAAVTLTHKLNGGTDGTATATLTVNVPVTHDLRLDPSGASSLGVAPGSVASFFVLARNAGNVQEQGALTVTGLPAGWTSSVNPTSLDLSPGAAVNVTVGLTPPQSAPHLAQADVRLVREGGGSVQLVATVGAGFGVGLQAPGGLVLNPGVAGLLNLTVKNTGNAPDTLVLRLGTLPTGWQGSFLSGLAEERRDLDPGQSAVVQATIRPPADAASAVPLQATVTATSLADAGKTVTRTLLLTLEEPSSDSASESSTPPHKKSPDAGPLVVAGLVALALVARRRR